MSHAAVSRLIVPVLGLGMIVSFASSYYLMAVSYTHLTLPTIYSV